MRETLHVVRKIAADIDDGRAEAGLRRHAGRPEAIVDELREHVGRDLAEPQDGAGLVERPARADHLLHQARLGAGEDVADLALLLDGGAQGIFDAAAFVAGDGLELVHGDDDAAA